MASVPLKKKAGAGKTPRTGAKPAPLVAPPTELAGQNSLVYTVGFALAVVSFVIGVYQTMVERDLASNYWLFMISLGFLFGVRWWRLRQSNKSGGKLGGK